MTNRALLFKIYLFILFPALLLFSTRTFATEGISLYTPYTKISVPPGESVDYSIDVINKGEDVMQLSLFLKGLPQSWDRSLMAGGYQIEQISVLPGEKKSLKLNVVVPMQVNKGTYKFTLNSQNGDELPMAINVAKKGTYKTEFTSTQINLQGDSKMNFAFTTKLRNQTAEKQVYSLHSNPPRGWQVIFKPNYKQATAVEIEPNSDTNISVEVKAPYNVEAGSYKIPVAASNRSTSASIELEVVITGTYEMDLKTPTGLLSTQLTAGSDKRIELVLVNAGSVELKDIKLSASKPKSWDVTFKPDTISQLAAGENAHIFATIKAHDKAIPGDYAVSIEAKTKETASKAAFRVAVKTPLLWGWLGILVIVVILGAIFYLFKKFGRR